MQKPAAVNIATTNIANYGSQAHHDLKESAAKKEKEFEGAGKALGVEVWHIENFGVKRVDKKLVGGFYAGDCYIVLNTYKKDAKSNAWSYNVHFWLGKDTSQDEMGTAAYKTVELDDLLRDMPVQFREVQNYESQEFLQCFGGHIRTMEGGVASAFHNVKPEDYKPRLFHVKGRFEKCVSVHQVPCARASLNEGDTFILDLGLKVFQWDGQKAGVFEKRKGEEVVNGILEERNGVPKKFRLSSGDDNADFWKALGGKGPVAAPIPDTAQAQVKPKVTKKLFRLSDASGKMDFTEVASGSVPKSALKPEDVFILDSEVAVFAWIGSKTSPAERKNAVQYATTYLQKAGRPIVTPVLRVLQNNEPQTFLSQLN